jgi:hypothetical protein
MSPVRRHTGFAPERKPRGTDLVKRSSKIAAGRILPRSRQGRVGRVYTGNVPDGERFDRLRKRTVRKCVLSNYLSRQALVLCGSRYHIFHAVPTGEFSAVFQPTDLREAGGGRRIRCGRLLSIHTLLKNRVE